MGRCLGALAPICRYYPCPWGAPDASLALRRGSSLASVAEILRPVSPAGVALACQWSLKWGPDGFLHCTCRAESRPPPAPLRKCPGLRHLKWRWFRRCKFSRFPGRQKCAIFPHEMYTKLDAFRNDITFGFVRFLPFDLLAAFRDFSESHRSYVAAWLPCRGQMFLVGWC